MPQTNFESFKPTARVDANTVPGFSPNSTLSEIDQIRKPVMKHDTQAAEPVKPKVAELVESLNELKINERAKLNLEPVLQKPASIM